MVNNRYRRAILVGSNVKQAVSGKHVFDWVYSNIRILSHIDDISTRK